MELLPHQKKAVDELHNGRILKGGVGSGKSKVAANYYIKNEKPKDVYVITTAKKRNSLDWNKEFDLLGVGTSKDATIAGVLTVDSWNNISKYIDVYDAFFIFDEQRLVGRGAWSAAFIKIAKRNNWIMLTATPGDTWIDYVPVFIANGWYKNRTEFQREHVIYAPYTKFPKILRYTSVNKLVRYRNNILVEMPYLKHTVRNSINVKVDYDKDLLEKVMKKRWHVYENRPLRNVAELFFVLRKVVNSDSSRLMHIMDLIEKHPKLIVFYNFDYELEILRTLSLEENTFLNHSRNGKNFGERQTHNSQTLSNEQTNTTSVLMDSTLELQKNKKLKSEILIKNNSIDSEKSWEMDEWKKQKTSLTGSGNSSEANLDVVMMKDSLERLLDPMSSERETSKSLAMKKENGKSDLSKDGSRQNSEESLMPKKQKLKNPGQNIRELQVAEWNGHKHEKIPAGDNWVYLVQYVAGAEAWDCIETNAICFYSMTYSYKLWHQAHGRIDRLNTLYTNLYYYVLKSNAVIDQAISKSLSEKRSFNESKFIANL